MTRLDKWFGFAQDEIFDEGIASFDRGDFEEAIQAFDTCIDSDPEPKVLRLSRFYRAESHAHLGQKCMLERRPLDALRHFEAALRHHEDFPELNLAAARACRELGAHQRAEWLVGQALRINPRHAEAKLLACQLWVDHGRFAEAVEALDAMRQVEEDLDPLVILEAKSAMQQGDRDLATELLQCLIAMISGDAALRAEMAERLMQEARFTEAAEAYRRVLDLVPCHPGIQERYQEALRALGHVPETPRPRFRHPAPG